MAGRGDHPCIGAEAGKRMRGAPGIGNRGACGETQHGEAADKAIEHGGLAAMQVIGAGRVDDNAVWVIGGDDGGDALQYPKRQPLQRFGVARWIRVADLETGGERLRPGRGHADAHPEGSGRRIGGRHDASAPVPADDY